MSSLKSVGKTGIRKISINLSPVKLSKVGAIYISEKAKDEKTITDKDFLSNDIRGGKSFKKTRKSSLASKARNRLEAFEATSDYSWQNGSNTNENEKARKKTDILKIRISRRSTLPGKLKRASTTCSLSDGKSSVLKDIAEENKVNHSKNKSGKKLSHISKKREFDRVHGKNLKLKEIKETKSAKNSDATTNEEMSKENYEFESEPRQFERSKTVRMSEMVPGKQNSKRVSKKVQIDFSLEPLDILKSKYEILYSDYRQKKNTERALISKDLQQEITEPKRKENNPTRRSIRIAEFTRVPVRRSIRIAAMERNKIPIS